MTFEGRCKCHLDLVGRTSKVRDFDQLYEECKAEIQEALEGLPKETDDICYSTLVDSKHSVEDKISKCKRQIPAGEQGERG
eukprot:Skav234251  [mRNA]  locus=scaffold1464:609661:610278:- [translate_table: standard]